MPSLGRILLIDSEPLVLEMFESLLNKEGYDVTVASSINEVFSYLGSIFFDIVICDITIEGLDSFDFLSVARKYNPNLALILVTNMPIHEEAQLAEEQCALYVTKPIAYNALLDSIYQASLQASGERALAAVA
jgi:DNA-binding NtrC family response regulator